MEISSTPLRLPPPPPPTHTLTLTLTLRILKVIHEHTTSFRFLGIILDFSDLRFTYTMFTLQISFKKHFLKGWGSNQLVEVTVNNKEENYS
jgi:hypothetical protein